jgi:hypothetical protein
LLDISLILVGWDEGRHFLFGFGEIIRNFLNGILDQVDEVARLLDQLLGVPFDGSKYLRLKCLVSIFQLANLRPEVRDNPFDVGHSSDNVILVDLVGLHSLESEAEHILVDERIMDALKFPFISLKVLI